jgi:hypothetical protein
MYPQGNSLRFVRILIRRTRGLNKGTFRRTSILLDMAKQWTCKSSCKSFHNCFVPKCLTYVCQDTGWTRATIVVPADHPYVFWGPPTRGSFHRGYERTELHLHCPTCIHDLKNNNFIFTFAYSHRLPEESQILSFFLPPTIVSTKISNSQFFSPYNCKH